MTGRRTAIAFVAPALSALAVVAVYPVLAAVWLSLHREILIFREHRFIGVANWSFLLRDERFWAALGHTTYFVALAVAIELLLGLAFALLLHRGSGLLRASVLVPWAVPTVVSAKLWAWLYDPNHGLITRMLPISDVNLLGTPLYALHAAIVVDVWKTTPFVALILLTFLSTPNHRTVPAAIAMFAPEHAEPWGEIAAASTIATLPLVILALVFQRRIVSGLTAGAVKG